MHICAQVLCGHMFSLLFNIYPEVELLNHRITTWSVYLLRNCQTFYKVTALFCIPSNSVCEPQFSTSVTTVVIVCIFYFSHLMGCEMGPHFGWCFPMTEGVGYFCHMLCGHMFEDNTCVCIFLKKCLFGSCTHF